MPYCFAFCGIMAVSGLYAFFLRRSSSLVSTIKKTAPSTPATMPYDFVKRMFPASLSAGASGNLPWACYLTSEI